MEATGVTSPTRRAVIGESSTQKARTSRRRESIAASSRWQRELRVTHSSATAQSPFVSEPIHSSFDLQFAHFPVFHQALTSTPETMTVRSKMLLVGAGPGDPELLTIKAVRAIESADLVLADRLVPHEVLAMAKCEVRVARKRCGKADLAQAELDAWGLEALRQGKRVVRLKNGDPFMYGRGGEEAVIYSEAGFEVDVIPGISSSLSAPLSAGIPATMRGIADQVLVCTGHGKADSFPNLPEYCDHRTVIFLMAIGRIEGLCASLINERGFPRDLPAAVIHAATTENSVTIRTTLGNIAEEIHRQGINPPGTLIVGNVVNALTYLKHYAVVRSSANDDLESTNKYQISYAPLDQVPHVDLGEHIVLNAGGKNRSVGSLWHLALLFLPLIYLLYASSTSCAAFVDLLN